jgi:hypothetical protein
MVEGVFTGTHSHKQKNLTSFFPENLGKYKWRP